MDTITPETAEAIRTIATARLMTTILVLLGMLLMVCACAASAFNLRRLSLAAFAAYGATLVVLNLGYSRIFGTVIALICVARVIWDLSHPSPLHRPELERSPEGQA